MMKYVRVVALCYVAMETAGSMSCLCTLWKVNTI